MVKQIISFFMVIAALLTCFILVAFAKVALQQDTPVQVAAAVEGTDSLSPEQKEYKEKYWMEEQSRIYDIDINGLTFEQVQQKLQEIINQGIIEKARMTVTKSEEPASVQTKIELTPEQKAYKEKCWMEEQSRIYDIDINGLTFEQVQQKVKEIINQGIIEKARMTAAKSEEPASVQTKIELTPELKAYKEKYWMEEQSRVFGIDINGLTFEQVQKKVQEIVNQGIIQKE